MEELKFSSFDYKVISLIYHLNKLGKYPNTNGVFKLLTGVVDDETKDYTNIPGFSSLISTTQKRVTFKISMLIRYGIIANIYDKKFDKFYLKILPKGEAIICEYLAKHKAGFKQMKKTVFPSIVSIKN